MVIKQAIDVLEIEAEGILSLKDKIDSNFETMVDLICKSKGRVIIGGIGKSGLVGRKIVATLNSTGTNSFFLHPVEAMHGDLGMVSENDIFIGLSNSGETEELNCLLPSLIAAGCPVIAFTGNKESTLAKQSSIIIDVGVEREACPLGLAPTTSTTALLAMGDALASVLISKKQFRAVDFKKSHPGGLLGQRLSNRIEEIMLTGEKIPTLQGGDLKTAIDIMDRYLLGVVLVIDSSERICGIITDGDIRHFLADGRLSLDSDASEIMTREPLTAKTGTPVYDALNIMEKHQITVLPVISEDGRLAGILHLHDILGKGAFKFTGS